jgi:predicted dehydrogenase
MAKARLKFGIVGACGRGASFKSACDAMANVTIQAICDVNVQALPDAAQRLGAKNTYADYEEMLDKAGVDAVIIGTPMQFHVPQARMAIERGIHAMTEVPAGVSIAECRKLVQACNKSKAVYMMAENYTYMELNVLVRELARQGLFGTTYYGEGEYLHELKGLNEVTKWRRKWQTGIAGVTYGTHSLGPILQWMAGDRVVSACCAGGGHHYRDPRGDAYENDESTVMLGQMRSGGLVKIRVDMLSDRPHAMTNYQLQGTDGCYESGRGGPVDRPKIWLRKITRGMQWMDLDAFLRVGAMTRKYLPDMWRTASDVARRAGHGGGDYFEVLDFVNAIEGKASCPIGIHEAMDMTLPGLVSQQSILKGGRWLDVPDSRTW